MKKLLLASSSQNRKSLLKKLKVKFESYSPNITETPLKSEGPRELVKRVSLLKAKKALKFYKDHFIISADTVVYARKQFLEKTNSRQIAFGNLTKLSGRRHQVFTGITFINNKGDIYYSLSVTRIRFKLLSKFEIEQYLNLNEWQECAGSYSIQGFAECFIDFISGSYSNVVGFPLVDVYKVLKKNDFLV